MIYIRGEGGAIRTGLNVYPPKEWKYSRGFILRIGKFQWSCRWSVIRKKWFNFIGKIRK